MISKKNWPLLIPILILSLLAGKLFLRAEYEQAKIHISR